MWNKNSQKISTGLARHHLQRFPSSDAVASTQCSFYASWIGVALALLKQYLICIQIFGSLFSYVNMKAASIQLEAASAVTSVDTLTLNLHWALFSCSILIFIFSSFHFIPIYPKPGHLKNKFFLLFNMAWIFLSYPLSTWPLKCDTHLVFLQRNISQCVQIWIFNISNKDSFTQFIHLLYK